MRKPVALALTLPLVAAPFLAAPAQAQDIVNKQKLERNIERGFKQQRDLRVVAKCPKQTTWVKGKVFFCRVTAADGTKGRIQVTLRSNATKGRLVWRLV
jgi:hypothetical protein